MNSSDLKLHNSAYIHRDCVSYVFLFNYMANNHKENFKKKFWREYTLSICKLSIPTVYPNRPLNILGISTKNKDKSNHYCCISHLEPWAFYYKTLQIRNLWKMDKFRSKLMCFSKQAKVT